ncbi:CIC11C00000002842 [Sungouiella intermedia]|uniref:Transcription initiation factor TFIID subunit 4 n=1 Tax=Sungouiella intermedia TaxID=45354 RepID=A0A1L0GFV0_9ASCO|nr:CIC11C00000002842 [[Candida] intermedia]
MSLQSGTPVLPKRPREEDLVNESKRIKTEAPSGLDESQFGDLFDPLPFETKDGFSSADFAIDDKFDLPNMLDAPDNVDLAASTRQNTAPASNAAATSTSVPGAVSPAPGNGNGRPNTNPALQGAVPRVNSTSKLPDYLPTGSGAGLTTPNSTQMYQSMSQLNLATYPYQRTSMAPTSGMLALNVPGSSMPGASGTGVVYPNQYRPPMNNAYRPATNRFDPKRTFPPGMSAPNNAAGAGNRPDDPSKLNDALAAAGVDIQREEELLLSNYNRTALSLQQQQLANRQRQTYGPLNAFLHPYHVALLMNKVARENGVVQNFMVDPEMLEFMSAACKEWLSDIVTKTVALSRHRRRGIPALNKNGAGKPKTIHPSQRSEISKELRNLALRQKEAEERRVLKRLALGLEKSDEVAPETGNKAGAEETLHRAANATAAMMTMNPARKKYSWMTSGASSAGDGAKLTANKDGGPKQSALISTRGDNGLRFREIRTGNMITTKDLLGVLEEDRMGTSKAVVKGYAKLKD